MSIVRRNGEGKLKPDWSVIVTLLLFLAGGGTSSLGAYYAIKSDLRQQDYRITLQEKKTSDIEAAVNNMRLKDAQDSEAFRNACATLSEIKEVLKGFHAERRTRRE